MADADAQHPPPDAAISPSPDADAAAAAIGEQLAGLGLDGSGGFVPEPSGWEDGPDPVAGAGDEAVGAVGDEFAGAKLPELAAAAAAGVDSRVRFPRRPGEPDCTYYLKFGNCRFGVKCKFNHPARKKRNRVKASGSTGSGSNSSSNKASSPDDDQAPREEYEGFVPDGSDSVAFVDKTNAPNSQNHRKASYEVVDTKKGRSEPKEKTGEEVEKGTYLKKFDETNVSSHKGARDKRKESISEGSIQEECKYYSTPGGCKFGKACKYLHREGNEGKTEVEKVELNFLGLPLRPGGKECPYYMRTGSCKYATNCKFHHPDPTNVPSKEPVLDHENGDTPQQNVQGPSQPNAPIWPERQGALNEHHGPFLAPQQPFSAGMIPPQGMYPPPDWSGYHQVPMNSYYPPGVPFQHFPAPVSHPMYKATEIPGHGQLPSDEYPERPGQPECQHFVRSGFCKYRMKCRYHHPRSRLPAPGGLSPLGLPIKPDQPVCTYYGRYGVCKYGPACMFNHPFSFVPPVPAAGPAPTPGQYNTPAGYFTV